MTLLDPDDDATPGGMHRRADGHVEVDGVFLEPGDAELFIVFGDRTNRDETYGAGRFLDIAAPVGGEVVIDFNKAYNPPCVFTAYATCPLPPPVNRLPLAVPAGERNFGKGHAAEPEV